MDVVVLDYGLQLARNVAWYSITLKQIEARYLLLKTQESAMFRR